MNAIVEVLYDDCVGNPNFTADNNPFDPRVEKNIPVNSAVPLIDLAKELFVEMGYSETTRKTFCEKRKSNANEAGIRVECGDLSAIDVDSIHTFQRKKQPDPHNMQMTENFMEYLNVPVLAYEYDPVNAPGRFHLCDGETHGMADINSTENREDVVFKNAVKFYNCPPGFGGILMLQYNVLGKADLNDYDIIRIAVNSLREARQANSDVELIGLKDKWGSNDDILKKISIMEKYNCRLLPTTEHKKNIPCSFTHTDIMNQKVDVVEELCKFVANDPFLRNSRFDETIWAFWKNLQVQGLLKETNIHENWKNLVMLMGGMSSVQTQLTKILSENSLKWSRQRGWQLMWCLLVEQGHDDGLVDGLKFIFENPDAKVVIETAARNAVAKQYTKYSDEENVLNF
jgi:hypothetical protein